MAFVFEDENFEDGFVLTSMTELPSKMKTKESVGAIESHFHEAKLKTETLIGDAEKNMSDLSCLIGKFKSGTATKTEREDIKSLHKKLDQAKEDILLSKTNEKELEVRVLHTHTQEKVDDIVTEIKKKDIRAAVRAVALAESVDLCFVIDCTSSMANYISAAKDSIRDIVKGVRSTNIKLKLRLAVVGYRDLCDGPNRFETLDFTFDTVVFESFLSNLSAIGGGDTPEDMAGGILKTNCLNWTQTTRVVFLIADAPCHGTIYHGGIADSYPCGTPDIDIINELTKLNSLANEGSMTLNFGRITSQTDTMIHKFGSLGINMDVYDLTDAKKMTAVITKSVRRSVFKTMTVTGGGKKSVGFAHCSDASSLLRTGKRPQNSTKTQALLKPYTIVSDAPISINWSELDSVEVKVFRNMQVRNISDLQQPINIGMLNYLPGFASSNTPRTEKTKQLVMMMRRAASPFAQGEIRLAYHAQMSRKRENLPSSGIVLKAYKHLGKGINSREQYFKQMEVSTIACFLAKKYNDTRPSDCAPVKFLQVVVVEEEDASTEEIGCRRFCAEKELPRDGTEFAKYSNNTGHWDEELLDESLVRFTKFTYEATKGYLMVTDLQGVEKDGTYHLTDPVILCSDVLRFGNTNLGEDFMKKSIDATSAYMKEYGWSN